MRVPLGLIHRGIGDTAADAAACSAGDAAACTRYYAAFASAPSVVAAKNDPSVAIDDSAPQAFDYPQAPGCHVVNLAMDQCLLDDGTPYGCNGIQECDPLTGARHEQFGLPTPTNTGDPALKTGGAGPTQFNNIANPNLTNPTGGTPSVLRSVSDVQAAINNLPATQRPTQLQITGSAAAGSGSSSTGSGSAGSGSSGGGGSASGNPSTNLFACTATGTNWFTQCAVGSVPNWILAGGGLIAAFYLWKALK